MALTVEDGTGLSTANAYVAVTFVDGYHTERCNDGWLGAVSEKEAAIIKATEYIDRAFCFQGGVILDTQALAWPRNQVVDDEFRLVPDDSVPVLVQRATAEMALAALTLTDLEPRVETARLLRRTERVGDVSTAMTFDGGVVVIDANSDGQLAPEGFPLVRAILGPLLADTNSSLVRS